MSGRDEEFGAFTRNCATPLHQTAYLLCGDWHLAHDLVQDTLVKAYQHWPRVRRADSPDAYVRAILLNEARGRPRLQRGHGEKPERPGARQPEDLSRPNGVNAMNFPSPTSEETQLSHDLRQLASGESFTPDLATIRQRARQRHRRGLALRGTAVAGAAVLAAGGVLAGLHGSGSAPSATAAGHTAAPGPARRPASPR